MDVRAQEDIRSQNNGLVNSVLTQVVSDRRRFADSLAARAIIMGAEPAKKEKAATASASPKSGVNPLIKGIGKFGGCVMKDDFSTGILVRLTACTLELDEAPIKKHFRI